MVANTYLEGTYSEIYPAVSEDEAGLAHLFLQFSFPGGIPSHAAPETPGSIHEGGELGYALVHAFGAAFDNPDLVVACVVGDGERKPDRSPRRGTRTVSSTHATTARCCRSCTSMATRSPTPPFSAGCRRSARSFFVGLGYEPLFVEGNERPAMHRRMASVLDDALDRIAAIQRAARAGDDAGTPRWPMIVLRSPKGWTGPKEVDGLKVEGFWRAHQVPIDEAKGNDGHRRLLEEWMRSYRPETLFDEHGRLVPELRALAPEGDKRMGATPYANGGRRRTVLHRPDWRAFALAIGEPGATIGEATRAAGRYLAEVMALNAEARNFRLMGPDETNSNRLGAVFEQTDRVWMERIEPFDEHLAPDGRVMEVLSEHLCQGWLEGYLLTGRHGLFNCYEAFVTSSIRCSTSTPSG